MNIEDKEYLKWILAQVYEVRNSLFDDSSRHRATYYLGALVHSLELNVDIGEED